MDDKYLSFMRSKKAEELANDIQWLCVAKKISTAEAVCAIAMAMGAQIKHACGCESKDHDHTNEMREIVDYILDLATNKNDG